LYIHLASCPVVGVVLSEYQSEHEHEVGREYRRECRSEDCREHRRQHRSEDLRECQKEHGSECTREQAQEHQRERRREDFREGRKEDLGEHSREYDNELAIARLIVYYSVTHYFIFHSTMAAPHKLSEAQLLESRELLLSLLSSGKEKKLRRKNR
jgi:hypothetical protein